MAYNPLTEILSDEKIEVELENPVNPLKTNLATDKVEVDFKPSPDSPPPPPPPVEEKTITTEKTDPPPPPEVEPPREKAEPATLEEGVEVDWQTHADSGLKLWDSGVSRVLQYLAKDDSRDPWTLTTEEKKELLPYLTKVAAKYKIKADSPEAGLIIVLIFIYGEKGASAWRMRKLKAEVEEARTEAEALRSEVERLKAEKEAPVVEDKETGEPLVTLSKSDLRAIIDKAIKGEAKEKKFEAVEIIEEKKSTPVEKSTPTPVEEPNEEFEAILRQLNPTSTPSTPSSTPVEGPISTPTPVENEKTSIPVETVSTPVEVSNAPPHPPPVVTETYTVTDADNFKVRVTVLHDGETMSHKVDTFEPVKELKGDRKTEIRRCLQTSKLFEAFEGQEKKFINKHAKQAYHDKRKNREEK